MAYKLTRGGGVLFDKYERAFNKNRNEAMLMYKNQEHLDFKKLNKFSKHVYLSWLNCSKNYPYRKEDIIFHCFYECVFNILKRNKDKIYKPFADIIDNFNH